MTEIIKFDIPGNNGRITKITKVKEVTIAINKVTGNGAEDSARSRLKKFKYLMKYICDNPFYLSRYVENLHISKELYPICLKMKNFLIGEKYIISQSVTSKYNIDYINYNFEIPLLAMPVVIAFIASINEKIGDSSTTIKDFFTYMDCYMEKYSYEDNILKEYPQYTKEELLTEYRKWMRIKLARDFFINLEELYNQFATNTEERKKLKYATMFLTQRVTRNTSETKIDEYENYLLEYKEKLNEAQEKEGSLYERWEAYPLPSEADFIEKTNSQFADFLNQLKSKIEKYISDNHRKDSKYLLAVQDIDDFTDNYNGWIDSLEKESKTIESIIRCYYGQLLCSDVIIQLVNEGRLLFLDRNIAYKTDRLVVIYSKAFFKIKRLLNGLYENVSKASGPAPENYSSKMTEQMQSLTIIDEISTISKNTKEKIEKYNFSEKYPSLSCHKRSSIFEQASFFNGRLD